MYPIWKDYSVTLSAADSEAYSIVLDNTTIYSGVAVKRPSAANIVITPNDVCADFFEPSLPDVSQTDYVEQASMVQTFDVLDSASVTQASIDFYPDYSYETITPAKGTSAPASYKVMAGQPVFLTAPDPADYIRITTIATDGTTNTTYTALTNNPGTFVYIVPSGLASFVLALSDGSDDVSGSVMAFEVVDPCHRYALLYVNAYGGWDSLLLRGRVSEAAAYTRYNHGQAYDNATATARGEVNYLNEVDRQFTLRTGSLTDGGAARLVKHLLPSPLVYLFDISTGEATPVTLGETQAEARTYLGEGVSIVSYDLTASVARYEIRR